MSDPENDGHWVSVGIYGGEVAVVFHKHEVAHFTAAFGPNKARQLIQQMLLALNKLEWEEK